MTDTLQHTLFADSLGGDLGAVFGASARVVPQPVEALVSSVQFTDNAVVWMGVVVLFVLYLFVLFAYGGHTSQMVKIIIGRNLGIRVADELSYLFMRAVRYALLMGVVMWSLVAVKWLDLSGVESIGVEPYWVLPLFVVVALGVGFVQRVVTNGMCRLVRRDDIAEGLNILADTLMAFVAIVTTPFALLMIANEGASALALGVGCVVAGLLALLVFCTKSLNFFIEQKVSILLLILYLCTAILIPIGIVATLVVRNCAI